MMISTDQGQCTQQLSGMGPPSQIGLIGEENLWLTNSGKSRLNSGLKGMKTSAKEGG